MTTSRSTSRSASSSEARAGRRRWRILVWTGLSLAVPPGVAAQSCEAPRRCESAWASRAAPAAWETTPAPAPWTAPAAPGDHPTGPGTALLLSAVVPGAGQYALGRTRWIAYAAAEVVGVALVVDRRRDGARLRDRYRDLAWSVARRDFAVGTRTDGDFEYYEDLSDWERSGAFDGDAAAAGVQPETDPTTYNGSVWSLARALYFPPDEPDPEPGDPAWERALAYYERRAYAPGFLWDWSEDPSSWARYGETIEASDERFRQATLFTGAVVANHLLSAVDAYVSARLSRAAGAEAYLRTRIGPGPGLDWSHPRMNLTLSFQPRSP